MLIKDKQMKKMPEEKIWENVFLPDDVILVHSIRRWGFSHNKKMDSCYLQVGGKKKTQFDSIARILFA